jgi:hypothetical protein
MDKPLCSILLPSFRGIVEAEACIRSIWDSCDNPDRVEICLRLQTNDHASIAHIPEFLKLPGTIRIMVGLPYGGYGSKLATQPEAGLPSRFISRISRGGIPIPIFDHWLRGKTGGIGGI